MDGDGDVLRENAMLRDVRALAVPLGETAAPVADSAAVADAGAEADVATVSVAFAVDDAERDADREPDELADELDDGVARGERDVDDDPHAEPLGDRVRESTDDLERVGIAAALEEALEQAAAVCVIEAEAPAEPDALTDGEKDWLAVSVPPALAVGDTDRVADSTTVAVLHALGVRVAPPAFDCVGALVALSTAVDVLLADGLPLSESVAVSAIDELTSVVGVRVGDAVGLLLGAVEVETLPVTLPAGLSLGEMLDDALPLVSIVDERDGGGLRDALGEPECCAEDDALPLGAALREGESEALCERVGRADVLDDGRVVDVREIRGEPDSTPVRDGEPVVLAVGAARVALPSAGDMLASIDANGEALILEQAEDEPDCAGEFVVDAERDGDLLVGGERVDDTVSVAAALVLTDVRAENVFVTVEGSDAFAVVKADADTTAENIADTDGEPDVDGLPVECLLNDDDAVTVLEAVDAALDDWVTESVLGPDGVPTPTALDGEAVSDTLLLAAPLTEGDRLSRMLALPDTDTLTSPVGLPLKDALNVALGSPLVDGVADAAPLSVKLGLDVKPVVPVGVGRDETLGETLVLGVRVDTRDAELCALSELQKESVRVVVGDTVLVREPRTVTVLVGETDALPDRRGVTLGERVMDEQPLAEALARAVILADEQPDDEGECDALGDMDAEPVLAGDFDDDEESVSRIDVVG